MSIPQDFSSAIGALMEVLDGGPPGMIIGGVAVIALGFPRTTVDIDATVWVPLDELDALVRRLGRAGIEPRMEVAEVFQSSWDVVFGAVERAVAYGREHLDLSGIQSLGIDEIAWGRGHRYLTVVYQIDAHCKRLLWVGEKRTIKTMLAFFHWLGAERSAALRFICSDMWKPYLLVIAKKAGQAIHVLDRFHIMGHFGKAIDEVRAQEARELRARGREPVLTKTRWLFLKRPENLTETQEVRLADLLRYNLRTVRSYLLKEDFQFFWGAAVGMPVTRRPRHRSRRAELPHRAPH